MKRRELRAKAALLGLEHPHSEIFLATLENLPEITAVSLWDPDPAVLRRFASRSGKVTQATSDLDGVLGRPDIDLALVCVRTDQAASLAHRVLLAGKHLLAEKPVGIDSSEIESLRSFAAQAGLVASVLYSRRAHPCAIAARRWVESGAIGPLLSLETRFLTTQVRFRRPDSWLFRRATSGGGILLWLGCHCLDLLHFITGDDVAEVGAKLAIRSDEAIDVEDTAALVLRFQSGAIGTFNAGYSLAFSGQGYANMAGYDSYLGINGRSGRIVWPDLDPHLVIESTPAAGGPARREETFDYPKSTSYGGRGGEDFFRQFIAACRGEGAPPTTLADAVRTARIIEAARQSSDTGRFVRIP